MDDALILGQKILSCVLRVQERFGADYVSLVLVGSQDERIMSARQNELSTWGLLRDFRRQDVRQWIEQLVGQGFLRKEGEYNTVSVTDDGRRLLRGERSPTLLRPAKESRAVAPKSEPASWEGVKHQLFEALRHLRRDVADQRGVPAYIVFGDGTLREMARTRPSTLPSLLRIRGIGQQKLADFGPQFLEGIVTYCREHQLETDVTTEVIAPPSARPTPSANAVQAFPLFDNGLSVEQVADRLGRAISTSYGYLEVYIRQRRVTDATPWMSQEEFDQVEAAIQNTGSERLRPIFDALEGRIGYERIRIAVACLENRSRETQQALARSDQLGRSSTTTSSARDAIGFPMQNGGSGLEETRSSNLSTDRDNCLATVAPICTIIIRSHAGTASGAAKRIFVPPTLCFDMSSEELQARLAAIVASSDDAIVSKDLNGIVQSWNEGAERIFGYPAAEMIGQSITKIIPPDRIDEEQQILSKIRRGERIAHFQAVRVCKDGRPVEVSVSISPIKDSTGKVIGASKIARDVTESNRLMRERERLYELGKSMVEQDDAQKLVQAITDAATDLSGAQFGAFFYNVINETGEVYMLYTLSGVEREHFEKFPMPRNTAVFEATFAGTGVVRSDDITQDPRYGQNAPFHGMPPGHLPVRSYLAVPVMGRGRNVLGGLFFGHAEIGVFNERSEEVVTSIAGHAGVALENARLQRELGENAARFTQLANSIPQLAWMAKPDGELFWYNDRWYEYTGADLESQRGWGWESVHDSNELPRVVEKWKAALARGEPWEDTFPLRRHDGVFRWHLSRAAVPRQLRQDHCVVWNEHRHHRTAPVR